MNKGKRISKSKIILLSLIISSSVGIRFSAATYNTYFENGDIKTVKKTNSDGVRVDFKEYDKSGNLITDYNYYDNGRVYERRQYYADGKKKTYYKKYNQSDGQVSLYYNYYSSGKTSKRRSWDNKGHRTDYQEFYTSGNYSVNYNYDATGKVSSKTLKNYNGDRTSYYVYYSNGKVKYKYNYYQNGKVKQKYTYNSSGVIIDYKEYTTKGYKIKDYDYYDNGKVNKKNFYYTNGNYQRQEKYRHNNQLYWRKDFNSSGKQTKYTTYKYDLQIAQFNVLNGNDNSYGSWSSRKSKVISAINNSNADIVSLNEVYTSAQRNDIAKGTGYKVIQPTDGSKYGWTSAIAYNPASIKLIKSGGYKFKSQEKYTSGSNAGKYASRTAVWGVFETRGIRFVFISGQTQNDRYTNIRLKQINELKNLGNSLSSKYNTDNIIIAGDLNEKDYKNSKCTKPLPTYYGKLYDLSYDYICSSNLMNTSGKTINSHASDHALVYSNTTLKR